MAENAYTAVTDTPGSRHTVTRTTGLSVLSGQALFTFNGSLSKGEVLEAFRACRRVLHFDGMSNSAPSTFPTSGSRTA